MTDEEIAISRSTPRYRFDGPPPAAKVAAPPKPPEPAAAVTPAAAAFVAEATSAREQPVVMFAL
jgi:cysteine synthase A